MVCRLSLWFTCGWLIAGLIVMRETVCWLVLFVGLSGFVVLVLSWWLVCFPDSGVWLFVAWIALFGVVIWYCD